MGYQIGFIGCGNMGGALLTAVAKTVDGSNIAVCDFDSEKVKKYESTLGVKGNSSKALASSSTFVVLGVKPQVIKEAIAEISQELKDNKTVTVITMAAGISISAIRSFLGFDAPVIRIMPNTPAMLGEGMILYATDGVNKQTEEEFLRIFAKAGRFDKLAEDKIDGASAISGCGPAFVYAFAEALADGGVECGIPRDKANLYVAQTLLGAAKMLLEYGHPADLKDAVCSPGGTTIAGMHALEKGGLRSSAMDAVTSAYEKTLSLKK